MVQLYYITTVTDRGAPLIVNVQEGLDAADALERYEQDHGPVDRGGAVAVPVDEHVLQCN